MHKESEKSWLAHLAEDQRYAAMAGLGFSSGLPFLLVYSTQSAWLSEATRARPTAAVDVFNEADPVIFF